MKKLLFSVLLSAILCPVNKVSAQNFPVISAPERLERLAPPDQKIRMVLDTDTYNEIDDQFAVVYALLSEEKLDVEALYAAPFFNNRSTGPGDGMEKSYEEILRLLDRLDLDRKESVFKGSYEFLKDLDSPLESPAARDLIERARSASPSEPLYVVTLGAITNVASAILLEPDIIDKIVVVWIGGNAAHWQDAKEFNLLGDPLAARLIFDCGVPLVELPCMPVITHFTTTVPEMEAYLKGRGKIGDYLLEIFKDYNQDHFAWSKVIWDMTAIAWLINPAWTPSNLINSPILTDELKFEFDDSRHLIRAVYFIHRDGIFRDFFTKIDQHAGD